MHKATGLLQDDDKKLFEVAKLVGNDLTQRSARLSNVSRMWHLRSLDEVPAGHPNEIRSHRSRSTGILDVMLLSVCDGLRLVIPVRDLTSVCVMRRLRHSAFCRGQCGP